MGKISLYEINDESSEEEDEHQLQDCYREEQLETWRPEQLLATTPLQIVEHHHHHYHGLVCRGWCGILTVLVAVLSHSLLFHYGPSSPPPNAYADTWPAFWQDQADWLAHGGRTIRQLSSHVWHTIVEETFSFGSLSEDDPPTTSEPKPERQPCLWHRQRDPALQLTGQDLAWRTVEDSMAWITYSVNEPLVFFASGSPDLDDKRRLAHVISDTWLDCDDGMFEWDGTQASLQMQLWHSPHSVVLITNVEEVDSVLLQSVLSSTSKTVFVLTSNVGTDIVQAAHDRSLSMHRPISTSELEADLRLRVEKEFPRSNTWILVPFI